MQTLPSPLRRPRGASVPPALRDARGAPTAGDAVRVVRTLAGDATVLALQGALDLAVAGPLRVALGAAVEAAGATGGRVVVDLEEVSFLDSSGLGELVRAYRGLRRSGGSLRLAAAGDQPLLALRLTNLLGVLGGEGSADEAAAALADAQR